MTRDYCFLEQSGEITEFTRQSIKAMIDKVAMFRANQYERVMEEVKEIMGGKILDYEAKDISKSNWFSFTESGT